MAVVRTTTYRGCDYQKVVYDYQKVPPPPTLADKSIVALQPVMTGRRATIDLSAKVGGGGI